MKKNLLFLCLVFSFHGIAQVHVAMPPDAEAFYNKAIPLVKPGLKKLIIQTSDELKNRQANADSLIKALHANPVLNGMSSENIEGLSTLILVQASKNADDDLKKMVLGMRNDEAGLVANSASGTKSESPEQIHERKQVMLQMIAYQKSKMAEEISIVMKKISDNKENIINNLK